MIYQLSNILPTLDIDGNGIVDEKTDGLLISRYLMGMRGVPLTAGELGSGATRNAAQIEACIATPLN